jgi:hypothetical protein
MTPNQALIVARAMDNAAWRILTKACELRDTLAAPMDERPWPSDQFTEADLDAYYDEWRGTVEAENAAVSGHLAEKPTSREAFDRAMERRRPTETISL